MNQRLVKPAFWPVMVCSSIFLAVAMYFIIGGMISNRFEDILIAFIVGFILFLAILFIRNNAFEPPKAALVLICFWPVVVIILTVMMFNDLTQLDGGVGQFFSYAQEMLRLHRQVGASIPATLQRSFFLSGGVMATVLFLLTQIATCVLLVVGTKPDKKTFRH
jgi:hypothetical protein